MVTGSGVVRELRIIHETAPVDLVWPFTRISFVMCGTQDDMITRQDH